MAGIDFLTQVLNELGLLLKALWQFPYWPQIVLIILGSVIAALVYGTIEILLKR